MKRFMNTVVATVAILVAAMASSECLAGGPSHGGHHGGGKSHHGGNSNHGHSQHGHSNHGHHNGHGNNFHNFNGFNNFHHQNNFGHFGTPSFNPQFKPSNFAPVPYKSGHSTNSGCNVPYFGR